MNPVDLVLTVCLAANPDACRTEHIYIEQSGSIVQCMLRAPGYIAQWTEDHPEFEVVRWKCIGPNRETAI